jgi:hypothetical protein
MRLVVGAHRQDLHLHRRQPGRQGTGGVLEQHAEEPVERPEQGPVDHLRLVALVVGAHVLDAEPARLLEVDLQRRELPTAPDGVAHVHVDLGRVERPLTLGHHVGNAGRLDRQAQRHLGLVPVGDLTDELVGPRRELGLELVETEVPQQLEHERQQAAQLARELLRGAEDVRIVLGEAPRPEQAVHHPRLLVPVDRPELEQPQRQLAVGALPRGVDEQVHGAVHRLGVVLLPLVELHGRVHAVGVPVEVAAGLEQLGLGDVRREHELVAGALVLGTAVVLHELADQAALGVVERKAAADLGGKVEQVQLEAELSVVALRRLFQLVEVGFERLAAVPRRAIDALQLCVVLVASPIGAGHPQELEMPEVPPGVLDVRSPAQVDEARSAVERRMLLGLGRRVLVGAYGPGGARGRHRIRRRVADDLELQGVVGEDPAGVVGRDLIAHERLLLVDDLAHAGVDAVEVVRREGGATR